MADASTSHAQWNSPFSRGTSGAQDTTKIPSFKNYRGGSETSNKVFQYFMVGSLGGISAFGVSIPKKLFNMPTQTDLFAGEGHSPE